MATTAFNKTNFFTSNLDLNLRKNLVKCCIWSRFLYGTEIPWCWMFLNVVLEKGEDQLDQLCEE